MQKLLPKLILALKSRGNWVVAAGFILQVVNHVSPFIPQKYSLLLAGVAAAASWILKVFPSQNYSG
jgi:hypothetical protein